MSLPSHLTHIQVPPIKTQGIKTKLVKTIASSVEWQGTGRWIEPFLGSGVVLFNIAPKKALVSDTNKHIIRIYQEIQARTLTPESLRDHLQREGRQLEDKGESHYYYVRDRFNESGAAMDFIFLNRASFNGVIRFNSKGRFNTPFCRKPLRFAQAYVTKICNQVRWVQQLVYGKEWTFLCQDWRETLALVEPEDFVYLDPPYVGRHTDYFNTWSEGDADDLACKTKAIRGGFAYSMWVGNQFRENHHLKTFDAYPRVTIDHFYHIGASETNRNSMVEALVVSPGHFVSDKLGPSLQTESVHHRQLALSYD